MSSVGQQNACSDFSLWMMEGIGRMDLRELELEAFVTIELKSLMETGRGMFG